MRRRRLVDRDRVVERLLRLADRDRELLERRERDREVDGAEAADMLAEALAEGALGVVARRRRRRVTRRFGAFTREVLLLLLDRETDALRLAEDRRRVITRKVAGALGTEAVRRLVRREREARRLEDFGDGEGAFGPLRRLLLRERDILDEELRRFGFLSLRAFGDGEACRLDFSFRADRNASFSFW